MTLHTYGTTLTEIDDAVLAVLQANPDPIALSIAIRQIETFARRLKDAIRVAAVVALEHSGPIEVDGAAVSIAEEPEAYDYSVCSPWNNEGPLISHPKQVVSVKLKMK